MMVTKQKHSFRPELKVLQPGMASGDNHLGSVTIAWHNQKVVVRMYEGGALRILANQAPMDLTEAFLKGKGGNTIIQLQPSKEA